MKSIFVALALCVSSSSQMKISNIGNNQKPKRWVELPACDGTSGEVALLSDLSNATWATCKGHPAPPSSSTSSSDTNESGDSNSTTSSNSTTTTNTTTEETTTTTNTTTTPPTPPAESSNSTEASA